MTLFNTQTHYGTITKKLHWLIAALIVIMITLGFLMGVTPLINPIHKALGLAVLLLMLTRIVFIYCNPGPKLPTSITPLEQLLSKLTKYALYATLLIMPLSGWIMASAANHPPHFGNLVIPFPWIRGAEWAHLFYTIHNTFVWVLITLMTLHILGVFKHQLIDKLKFIQRMM